MNRRCALSLLLSPLGAATAPARALVPMAFEAPNVVPVTELLITSGQPSRAALATFGALGIEAVIYLAPNTVPDAVQEEPEILARQGIAYVHVPIPFDAPTEAHFETVTTALQRLRGTRVLMHCQVNMRASTMMFLHRAITLREPPAEAYQAVQRVWTPQGPWKSLVSRLLETHGVAFQPL